MKSIVKVSISVLKCQLVNEVTFAKLLREEVLVYFMIMKLFEGMHHGITKSRILEQKKTNCLFCDSQKRVNSEII